MSKRVQNHREEEVDDDDDDDDISSFSSACSQQEQEQEYVVQPTFEVSHLLTDKRRGPHRKPRTAIWKWTPEADQLLTTSVETHGPKNWKRVAQDIPERTATQCLQRWSKVLRPGLHKGSWNSSEDEALTHGVHTCQSMGKVKWTQVSRLIPGRTAKQCRERWLNVLDPSINRGPWTFREDTHMVELVKKYGPSWSIIAQELGTARTEGAVKFRWKSALAHTELGRQASAAVSPSWTPLLPSVFSPHVSPPPVKSVRLDANPAQAVGYFGRQEQTSASMAHQYYMMKQQQQQQLHEEPTLTVNVQSRKMQPSPTLSCASDSILAELCKLPPPTTNDNPHEEVVVEVDDDNDSGESGGRFPCFVKRGGSRVSLMSSSLYSMGSLGSFLHHRVVSPPPPVPPPTAPHELKPTESFRNNVSMIWDVDRLFSNSPFMSMFHSNSGMSTQNPPPPPQGNVHYPYFQPFERVNSFASAVAKREEEEDMDI